MLRIVSGIQPTGRLHLGNYLGALRHWLLLQAEAECFFMLADLHAITVSQDPAELRKQTREAAAILLAIGIDPKHAALFLQSHISQHAELAWVLNCFTTEGELARMVQFKEKAVNGGREKATAGLLTYPVLQAADILLYQTDYVPVGHDQKQHLELTRTVALRFNRQHPGTFKIPRPLIAPEGSRIMDLRDPRQKMKKSSKSQAGVISLIDPPEVIRAKINAAKTDSGNNIQLSGEKFGISNLINVFAGLNDVSPDAVVRMFTGKTYTYFKSALTQRLVEVLCPIQTRYIQLRSDNVYLDEVLEEGRIAASVIAEQTLRTVYDRVGFVTPSGLPRRVKNK